MRLLFVGAMLLIINLPAYALGGLSPCQTVAMAEQEIGNYMDILTIARVLAERTSGAERQRLMSIVGKYQRKIDEKRGVAEANRKWCTAE